jgi:hypothetical protein
MEDGMPDNEPLAPGAEDRKPKDGDKSSWMIGVILVLLGIAFLLQNAGVVSADSNWWAIFIYLAAFASFANVWQSYRAKGGFTKHATGSLIWGFVLTVIATILLFALSWDLWWPAILIAVGAGIVLGRVLESRDGA